MEKIIIISGPTGVGKDAIIQRLSQEITFCKVIGTTTRPKRLTEVDGKDYHFLTEKKFEALAAKGEMLEWQRVYGAWKGTSKKAFQKAVASGRPILIKLDWQGTKAMKQYFPHALAIGIRAASVEIMEKRLRARAKKTKEDVVGRLSEVKEWLKHFNVYDYVVTNEEGKIDEAVAQIKDIIIHYLQK